MVLQWTCIPLLIENKTIINVTLKTRMEYNPAFLRWLRWPLSPRKGERALDEDSGGITGLASDFLDALGPILSFSEPGFTRELMSSPYQLCPTTGLLEGTWTTLRPRHASPGAALPPTRSLCSTPMPCHPPSYPRDRQTRIWIPTLLLPGCVALGKSLDLSEPQLHV